jgi:amino acid transporter
MSRSSTQILPVAETDGQGKQRPETRRGSLRRELFLFGAVALSVALMGPTMAMNLNPAAPAGLVGRAVPLAFVLAACGVLLVSYSFYRLTQRLHHAGSVYALSGVTLGPRAGFFSGWALMGGYVLYACCTLAAVGIFGRQFLAQTGVWSQASWIPIAIVAALAIIGLSVTEIRSISRTLLTLEGLSIVLVVALVAVIFAKVLGGTAPSHQRFTLSIFSLPHGSTIGNLSLAMVFGFLSFAGFEAAATLGEETHDPRRNIPRAIVFAAFAVGVYYVLCTTAQVLGFGTSAAGLKAYAGSSSIFGDLANSYVGAWLSDLIDIGAMVSAFSCALASVTGASRLLFALGRDGFATKRLGAASNRTGSPVVATGVVMAVTIVIVVALRAAATTSATDIFFWTATVGTFPLLVAYMVTNVGAIRLLFFRDRTVARWEIVVPVVALVFLGYVLWKNIYPAPAYPYNLFPYIAAGWMVLGLVIVLVQPGLAATIGRGLAKQEGLVLGGVSEVQDGGRVTGSHREREAAAILPQPPENVG